MSMPIPMSLNKQTPKSKPSPINIVPYTYSTYIPIDKQQVELDKIKTVDQFISVKLCDFNRAHNIALECAVEMHNQWRKTYIEQYGNLPRIKKNQNGIDVDINVDRSILDSEFLEFNYNMALFVASYIIIYKYTHIEETASIIHTKWLIMSPWAKDGPLDVSYEQLPESEKQKDRDIYNMVYNLYLISIDKV